MFSFLVEVSILDVSNTKKYISDIKNPGVFTELIFKLVLKINIKLLMVLWDKYSHAFISFCPCFNSFWCSQCIFFWLLPGL